MVLAADSGWVGYGLAIGAILLTFAAALYHLHHIRRAAAAINATQERLEDLAKEMYSVLQFAQDAMTKPDLVQRFRQLASSAATLFQTPSSFHTTFFRDCIEDEFDAMVDLARQASTGMVEFKPRDLSDFAEVLLGDAHKGEDVLTTSYVKAQDFWNTPSARAYLETTRRLIAEHELNVIRIFLFDDARALDDSKLEIEKHVDAGIHVRTALTGALEARDKRDLLLLGNIEKREYRLAAEYLMSMDRAQFTRLRVWTPPQREVAEVATCMQHLLVSSTESAGSGAAGTTGQTTSGEGPGTAQVLSLPTEGTERPVQSGHE